MNLERSLSNHQKYYLGLLCKGHIVLTLDPETGIYGDDRSGSWGWAVKPSNGKGRTSAMCGGHYYKAMAVLWQRGVIVDMNGRLMPSKEAQRAFGTPPPIASPKRTVKMHRTRAARVQE